MLETPKEISKFKVTHQLDWLQECKELKKKTTTTEKNQSTDFENIKFILNFAWEIVFFPIIWLQIVSQKSLRRFGKP